MVKYADTVYIIVHVHLDTKFEVLSKVASVSIVTLDVSFSRFTKILENLEEILTWSNANRTQLRHIIKLSYELTLLHFLCSLFKFHPTSPSNNMIVGSPISHTVYRETFVPFLFTPLSPSFVCARIEECLILFHLKQNFVCNWRMRTWCENNLVCTISLDPLRRKLIYILKFKFVVWSLKRPG